MSWFDVLKQWLKFWSNKMFSVPPLSTASASLLEKTPEYTYSILCIIITIILLGKKGDFFLLLCY